MNPRRARAADWQAVAGIRRLQSRAAEMTAIDAVANRRRAVEQKDSTEAALADAQRGWADALRGAFDPLLARHWFACVGERENETHAAAEVLQIAGDEVDRTSAAWHAAEVRARAAEDRRRAAVTKASRARDEARLVEIEDRAARQEKRS